MTPQGLTQREAAERLAAEGANDLPVAGRRTAWKILADIVAEPMFAFLLAAGAVYLLLGDLRESILMFVFASLSVTITAVQEVRGERVLEALRDLTSPRALVVRDGKPLRIPGRDVVRGDLIVVGEGDRVPADAVILSGDHIMTDESLLTGESAAVSKKPSPAPLAAAARPGGEGLPFIYAGSLVVRGDGRALVVATGSRLGDLWVLGNHKILCGSALEAKDYARLMGDDQAQMIFTDPPYNVRVKDISGLGKHKHAEFAMASGEMDRAEFLAFLGAALGYMANHSIDGSIHFVCMDWRHIEELVTAGRDVYTDLKNICVWAKDNGGMGSLYRSQHEFVAVFKNGTAPHVNNIQLGVHGRYRTNLWKYAGQNTFHAGREDDLAAHPTIKPTARYTTSVGGTLTGRGGDIVIVDDIMKADDAMSATKRDTAREWFFNTAYSRLDNKKEGIIIVVMQRLHQDDLVGHLTEKGDWEILNLPAIAAFDEIIELENAAALCNSCATRRARRATRGWSRLAGFN